MRDNARTRIAMDEKLPPLIQALHRAVCYDHPAPEIRLLETHISWVLLTGLFAYKIKKPTNLGFLDFSTLEKRRHYCTEELRLNRRLAPQLYLDVVPITGTATAPVLNGSGETIEYAVKMSQFPQAARLDHVLARGELSLEHIDLLTQALGEFHARAGRAGDKQAFGSPEQVYGPVHENFEQIRPHLGSDDRAQLRRLEIWSELSFAELKNTFAERKRQGFIRECHGDAHLANMAWLDKRVVFFDCLEFNENLRWIDVISELAFVVMDLDDRGRSDLARRALNGYLESTGDYAGLKLLRFYHVYRALVRAKVACIRLTQNDLSAEEKQRVRKEYLGYTELAERYTQPAHAMLIITHGLSGSGKTWLTQKLLETIDAVRVRSDVERKRLHGLAPPACSDSGIDTGLYTAAATQRTYEQLAQLAGAILEAGQSAIIDAAFLKRTQRDRLRALAADKRVPFITLDLHAPEQILRARIQQRREREHDASEADVAVLEHQLATQEPLETDEMSSVLMFNTLQPLSTGELVQSLTRFTARQVF